LLGCPLDIERIFGRFVNDGGELVADEDCDGLTNGDI
jgi:hypothetical protein